MDVPNPYAPPADLETTTSQRLFGQRDGLLAIRDGAELPHVCVISNVAVDVSEIREVTQLSSAPAWIETLVWPMLLIPSIIRNLPGSLWRDIPIIPLTSVAFIPVILLLASPLIWKRANVSYCLTSGLHQRFSRHSKLCQFLFLLTVVAFMILDRRNTPFSPVIILAFFFASMFFKTKSNPLRVSKHHDGWFLLKGASPEFVASLPPV